MQTIQRKIAMFKLVEPISGNAIRITPAWNWNGVSGEIVKINGIDIHSTLPDQIKAIREEILKQRLVSLFQTFEFKLTNPLRVELFENKNAIKCDILLNGVNIANYFPEYK